MREELFSFTGLDGSASRCLLRLLLSATGEPRRRITADLSQHAAALGSTLVKNSGENAELADALARSGEFNPQKEVLGGMMVIHSTLEIHLHRHKQGREQSRGFNPGGNLKRKGTDHKL